MNPAQRPHERICSLCFACAECERLLTGVEWHGNAHLCGWDECEFVELFISGHASSDDAKPFHHDANNCSPLDTV